MIDVRRNPWEEPPVWLTTLGAMAPLWLLSLVVMAEGFPAPPISGRAATVVLVGGLVAGIMLVWKRWMTIELLLYSLFPFALLTGFDEISTSYKTLFIFVCAAILSYGMAVYQMSDLRRDVRWLILLAAAAVTLLAAAHASSRYWTMVSELGYQNCIPDTYGCAPLTGQETAWWVLFFGL